MPDRIELRGLRVLAYCGALPEEQVRRQPFSIDADIEADLSLQEVQMTWLEPLTTAHSVARSQQLRTTNALR
jgi:hypothetical protein